MAIISHLFFSLVTGGLLLYLWTFFRNHLLMDARTQSTMAAPIKTHIVISMIIALLSGILLLPCRTIHSKRSNETASVMISISLFLLIFVLCTALIKYYFTDNLLLIYTQRLAISSALTALIPLPPLPAFSLLVRYFNLPTSLSKGYPLAAYLFVIGLIALESLGIPALRGSILWLMDTIILLVHFAL